MTDELVCPHGHRVPRDAVTFDGPEQRPQCPVCTALGQPTSAEKWSRPTGAPASLPWRRQALSVALWLVAAGFALGAVGSFLAYKAYADAVHLVYSDAAASGYLADAAGSLIVAIGCAAAATIVRRD